jgi:hypothetical protein
VSPGARLAVFGVALAATFGAGAAVGTAVGPWEGDDPPASHEDMPGTGSPGTTAHEGHDATPTTAGPAAEAHDGD